MGNNILRIGVNGASGKMGLAVLAQIFASFHLKAGPSPKPQLAAAIGRHNSSLLGTDLCNEIIHSGMNPTNSNWLVHQNSAYLTDRPNSADIDVLIDFSTPAAAIELTEFCVQAKVPLVIGTTGFTPAQLEIINQAAQIIPVLISANMSVAVNVMFTLLAQAVSELTAAGVPGGYDIQITELHQRTKKDSPSGTALLMREIAMNAAGDDLMQASTNNSRTNHDSKASAPIGVAALRGGSLMNEHRVILAGTGEQLELIHRAANLNIYAQGAIIAARFLYDKKPGIYSMKEALALCRNGAGKI